MVWLNAAGDSTACTKKLLYSCRQSQQKETDTVIEKSAAIPLAAAVEA